MAQCQPESIEAAQAAICAASPFWWVSPLVILISAIAAGYLSIESIRANRDIARKKATLDLIERTASTEYYQKSYVAFRDIRTSDDGFEQIFNPSNNAMIKQRQMVISFLNHYEIISIGIEKNILDEGVYKDYMKSMVVRDWFESERFIKHLRTPTSDSGSGVDASAAFTNFEIMALRWAPEVQLNLPLQENSN